MFRKDWTSAEAEKWTIEDTATVIISPLIYLLLLMSTLLMPAGFLMLALAVVLIVVMVKIINPKLSAISEAFEKKQKQYIEELEKKVKWEE